MKNKVKDNKKVRNKNKRIPKQAELYRGLSEEERAEAMRLERKRKAEAFRRKKGKKSITESQLDEEEAIRQRMLDIPEEAAADEVIAHAPERKKKPPVVKILMVLLIAILIVTLATAVNMMSLLKQRDKAVDRINELQQQKEELEMQMQEIGTESYMEKYARDWLKMTKSGEIVYRFTSEDGTPVVSEAAASENSAKKL